MTNVSVAHSVGLGARPSSSMRAGHFCSLWVSMILPLWKPLPRQSVSAAVWQSGAPFGASAQRSRALTGRAFGSVAMVPVASLAASRALLPNLSMPDLN